MNQYKMFIFSILYLSITADELFDLVANGDCRFYEALESIEKCGPDGYLISYGFKYCNKFSDSLNNFNEEGKSWVNSVKKCLMNSLLDKSFPDCKSLTDYAFESHVDCYLNPGSGAKGFCSIMFSNLNALAKVFELLDIFKQPYRSLKHIFNIFSKCIFCRSQYIDIVHSSTVV